MARSTPSAEGGAPIFKGESVLPSIVTIQAGQAGPLIAPEGECVYCDRRRARTAAKVKAWRDGKKGKA